MCTTCGCGSGQTRIEGEHEHTVVDADGTISSYRHAHGPGEAQHEHAAHEHGPHEHGHHHAPGAAHEHVHADGTRHAHPHDHGHGHGHDHDHAHGPAHAHAPGLTAAQMVRIERDILHANDGIAARNRRRFEDAGILALNLVSSPGAGKTTLLVETIGRLAAEVPLAVIEGDQQTSFDAERIRATGCRAIQVNTGKGCHLDAAQVERALAALAPADDSVLFIENVGNLVCPSAFDLGEAMKVVVLSVTEGEDKPLKYPDMFAASGLLLLNKVDLLPHVRFDAKRAIEYARRVRPGIEVLQLSATTGEGMAAWLDWLRAGCARARQRRLETVAALRRRVAELEAQAAQRR
jgi:hydrogenase nickel incorporation protein HypB